ncbi:ABC transporter permease [bacterium]|nr:ABC transporter permease [bacterium]
MNLIFALRNLLRHRRRTLAVVFTVAFGVGALFIFHGFNTGVMNQYRDNTVRSRYGHAQVNSIGYRDQVFEKPWEHWIEDPDALVAELKTLDGVEQVFPRMNFFALLTNGEITVSGRGQGVDGKEESKFFNTLNVEIGENLNTQVEGVLLGKGLATALKAKIGDRVTVMANTVHGSINALDFEVIGVFHTGSKDFDDVVFRVQLPLAQELLDTHAVEAVSLAFSKVEDWDRVNHQFGERLKEYEITPFEVLDKIYYKHSVDWLQSQFGIIQSIILVIVFLGIFNSISTSIFERKQEIGTLRANGEGRWDVFKLLCVEGGILGLIGALVGLGIGVLVTHTLLGGGIFMPPAPGITRQFHVFIELQASFALYAFTLGAGCALLSTAIASLKVVRMDIASALRSV